MGEQDRGYHAERIQVSYWDELGNETVRHFAANLPEEEIPVTIDSPSTGLPAGRDKENPPSVAKLEPYKTHLAYVKERRTEEEAATLLDEALTQLRARRGTLTN
jgi:RNA polymerase-binding protein